jgi:hypothetical protein
LCFGVWFCSISSQFKAVKAKLFELLRSLALDSFAQWANFVGKTFSVEKKILIFVAFLKGIWSITEIYKHERWRTSDVLLSEHEFKSYLKSYLPAHHCIVVRALT